MEKSQIVDLSEKNFEERVIKSSKPVLVDFYAPWCAPCRKMMPMIDSLKTEYKDKVTIVKINVDASKKLMKELSIVSVPYLVLYHKGIILYSKYGLTEKQELEKVFIENSAKHTKVQGNRK